MGKARRSIKQRVETAAEEMLALDGKVSLARVFRQMGWIQSGVTDQWRRGGAPLEDLMQASPKNRDKAIGHLKRWAAERGMETVEEPVLVANTRSGETCVHTSPFDAQRERDYLNVFHPREKAAAARKKVAQKQAAPDLQVFMIRRDSSCDECEQKLPAGEMIFLEKEKAYCLDCADLAHLEFLPRGDAALTRRARKHSALSAVVLEWSRRRKQYERQGLLVEAAALEQAEKECLSDADQRAQRRERQRAQREKEDAAYINEFRESIQRLFPGCPAKTSEAIAQHACQRGSGRVGRSAGAKALIDHVILLAVRAHIRHEHTPYDELLMQGVNRYEAREQIASAIDQVLRRWRKG